MESARGGQVVDAAAVIAAHTRDVPDFPRPGVLFKDLTPLFADGRAFRTVVDAIIAEHTDGDRPRFDTVVGIEARGFVLAAAIAYSAGVGFVPVRKAGKLPGETHHQSYALEYGEATLEVHSDAFPTGAKVLVVDDVLATGGTVAATLALLERAGAEVSGICVVLELSFLGGRARLAPREVHALSVV
jgi:adenine phosphoribosyltransferase